MSQSLVLAVRGLYTNNNELSTAPVGALKTADNIVINKSSIAEPRRGFNRLAFTLPSVSDRADKLFQYQNKLLLHYGSTSMAYYDASTGVNTYQGTYSHPDSYLARIKSAEANQNFYHTSSKGIQRLDLVTSQPEQAGMFKGLDILASAHSNVSGFMSNNTQVAYRAIWGKTDANENLIRGFPSQRAVLANQTGGLQDANLEITIPVGITVNHFYRLYRGNQEPALTTYAKGTIQDITYTAVTAGTSGNSVSVAYTTGGTAGSEAVSVVGSAISVQIQSGVSTARQVLAAVNNSASALALVSASITGTATNVQTAPASVTLSGGSVTLQTPDDSMQLVYEGTIAGSTRTIQDLTYTSVLVGTSGNLVTIAYTGSGTAGAEVVTVTGNAISVKIQSGVSTATQVLAAINASAAATALVSAVISGTGSNAQTTVSATALTGGTATVMVVDSTPDSLRGEALYTNANQEGILQANELPPYAADIAVFKECLFFGNIRTKQRLNFSILSAGGSAGIHTADTLTIAGTVYTASDGTGAASYQFTVTAANATVGATYTNSGRTFTVTSTIAGATTLVTTGTGAPATSGTLTKASGTGDATITFSAFTPEVISARQYKLYTTGSAAQNIEDTALSLMRVVNQNTTNTTVYAYYVSTPDDLPGQILIEERVLGGSAFSATASAHGSAFSPTLPTSGTTVSSSNEIALNGLMYSKQQQPDAVPGVNIQYVGSASKKILRILALRDSLFILKEDGIYRCTGSSPANFSIDLLDNTAILLAPESAVALNNRIFALTTQGVVAISDNGVEVLSRQIEDQLAALNGSALTAMQYYSFGVGYESERQYILWTVETNDDTYCPQAFVYNFFTEAWTRWTRKQQHAIVFATDDKIYAADPLSFYINQERKSDTFVDYSDEAIAVSMTAFSSYTLTFSDVVDIEVGDIIYQSAQIATVVTAVDRVASTITVNDVITSWDLGTSTFVLKHIECTLEWIPNYAQSAGYLKQWPEATLLTKQSYFNFASINFYSDVSGSVDEVEIIGSGGGQWGRFPWGEQAWWGGVVNSKPVRVYVPLEKQRCDLLSVQFVCKEAWARFQIEGVVLANRLISTRVAV
jgi:hypothetical protein